MRPTIYKSAKWRPLLCRFGLHAWRVAAFSYEFKCERCGDRLDRVAA